MKRLDPLKQPLNTVVVTGGAGFIGSHLVEALLTQGVKVVVVDNLSSGTWLNLAQASSSLTLIEADCNDLQAMMRACEKADCLFHLAAISSVAASLIDPIPTVVAGELALLTCLKACDAYRVPRIVYASSAAVYGSPQYLPIDEAHPTIPLSNYGVSKLSGEHYLRTYASTHAVSATALRFLMCMVPDKHQTVLIPV